MKYDSNSSVAKCRDTHTACFRYRFSLNLFHPLRLQRKLDHVSTEEVEEVESSLSIFVDDAISMPP